jgi:hypothetical protein
MKKSIIKILVILIVVSCSNKHEFETELVFKKIKTNLTEVRITLPDGGSKIVKVINEPIFESGESIDNEEAMTFTNKKDYRLIKSYFSRVSGKIIHFFIYSKSQEYIVFYEETNVAGFGESNVIYDGNIHNEINEVSPNYSELETLIFEGTCYSSSYELVNCKYELLIKGEVLILNMYQNDNLIKTLNGIYFEKNIYIDADEPFYTIENNQLCVSGEGFAECYAKKNWLRKN